MEEDEGNMFAMKYAQPQLRRKDTSRGRGRGGESRIIVLEGQLPPSSEHNESSNSKFT